MQSIKEKAYNVAASAKAGLEKTKATMQEKVDRMTAHHPTEKAMATEKKEERINHAEFNKQEAKDHNAAAKHATHATGAPHTYSTTGEPGHHPTGTHQMSALPGHHPTGTHQISTLPGHHPTGQPVGHVAEGVIASHPIGTATGTTRPSAAHNNQVGQAANKGYGTGGAYN